MHFYYLFLVICITCHSSFSKTIEIKCPSHCRCDFFENYRRANCTNQKLVVLESYLPKDVQLLDLSFNQISDLDDHTFFEQNLLSLKLLNISNNKISQVHMNAFDGLTDLKTLDLSNNAMRYLIEHWFWSLQSLEELYLRGNNFEMLGPDPQFESKTLKKLDLSKCGIAHIGNDAFLKIPNLEMLDISGNLLITINLLVIKPLTNLLVFRTDNNSFACNSELEEVAGYCINKGIKFKNPCSIIPLNSNKFERIMNLAPDIEDEKNSWIYEETEENKTVLEVCNFNNTNATNINKGMMMEIIHLSPILSILIPFVYGIAVGILIGCTVQIREKKIKQPDLNENTYESYDEGGHLRRARSASSVKRSSSFFSRKPDREATESLVMGEWNIVESTPVMPRKG